MKIEKTGVPWIALALIFVGLLGLLLLFGCSTVRPVDGGSARQEARWQPSVIQELKQPQNPEKSSKQELVEIQTEQRTDGTTVTTERRAVTELGGSQDMAGILKAWAKVKAVGGDRARDIIVGLALLLGAWLAWRRENTVIAALLALGALGSLFVSANIGYAAAGISALVYLGYLKGKIL